MLRVLIISDKPFLQDALRSYSSYLDVVLFHSGESYIDGYDFYVSDSDISRDNVMLLDRLVDVSNVIDQLNQILAKNRNVLEYKGLKLDIPSKLMSVEDDELDLTSVETNILKTLMMNAEHGASRDYLLNDVLGYTNDAETKALENHIYKLRKKLESIGTKVAIAKTDDGYKIGTI